MPAKSTVPLAKRVDDQLYIIGMTRADLAKKMEISICYLSYLLNCRYRPSIEMTERMAEIVGIEGREIRQLALKTAM